MPLEFEADRFVWLKMRKKPVVVDVAGPVLEEMVIHTLEGDHLATVGDYIIRGVHGEYYPIKPAILKATYEDVVE